jgi:hypothetical protein
MPAMASCSGPPSCRAEKGGRARRAGTEGGNYHKMFTSLNSNTVQLGHGGASTVDLSAGIMADLSARFVAGLTGAELRTLNPEP